MSKLLKSQEERDKKEHKQVLNKLVPIADYILKLMAETKCPMGDSPSTEEYKVLALKIQQKFLDEDVKWVDRHLVFQLVQQAVDQVKETTLNHLAKSFDYASQHIWQGKSLSDITMRDVDNVLKNMKK